MPGIQVCKQNQIKANKDFNTGCSIIMERKVPPIGYIFPSPNIHMHTEAHGTEFTKHYSD